MHSPSSTMIPPNPSLKRFLGNHANTHQKQLKLNSGLQGCQDPRVVFDLQLLLERQSLNETWNKLMKNGMLSSDQLNLQSDSLNNRAIGSPIGNFPCACCDRECDLKCLTTCQSPTSSSTHQERPVAKLLNSWMWSKEAGELQVK